MKVYAVMIHERHSDPEVELFAQQDDAVGWAREEATSWLRDGEELDEPEGFYGYLYYGSWSGEGEYVAVVEKEVR